MLRLRLPVSVTTSSSPSPEHPGVAEDWEDLDFAGVEKNEPVDESCDGVNDECDRSICETLEPSSADRTAGVCQGQVKSCGVAQHRLNGCQLLAPRWLRGRRNALRGARQPEQRRGGRRPVGRIRVLRRCWKYHMAGTLACCVEPDDVQCEAVHGPRRRRDATVWTTTPTETPTRAISTGVPEPVLVRQDRGQGRGS